MLLMALSLLVMILALMVCIKMALARTDRLDTWAKLVE